MTTGMASAPFPPDGRRLIVYAVDDPRGDVEDAALYALVALREHAESLLVVANQALSPEGRRSMESIADEIIVRTGARGLWGYRAALAHIGASIERYDEVVLTGDRWFGPVHPLGPVFERMDEQRVDLWGMTDRREPALRNDDGEYAEHADGAQQGPVELPTHWIAARRTVISSRAWAMYWRTLPKRPQSEATRKRLEQRMARLFAGHGYRLAAAFTEDDYPSPDPAMFNTELLLADGCPLVLRDVFDGYPLFFDQHAIVGRRLAQAMGAAGYPLALLWRDLARTLPPKRLYANAAMLEVLPDVARSVSGPSMRVLVVVHVPRLEGLDDVFDRLAWVPGLEQVVATIPDPALAAPVRALWHATEGVSGVPFQVRDAPGRTGPDTATVFAECRDLLDSGDYDLVYALHTGVPAGRVRNTVRYFRRQQIESLLSSAGYIANVHELFAREPGLGIVFPPTPHIGMSTLGAGWEGHRDRAQRVAAELGIRVPFDWASPHAPLGGMWIGRPEALRLLSVRPWPANDSGLIGAHVRLHSYAAGEAGFHTRTVTTAVHAGLSHGSLEYTLDHLSVMFYGYPQGYIGMLHRAGPYGSGRARDFARMYLSLRHPGVLRPFRGVARLARAARRGARDRRSVLRDGRRAS